MAQALEKDLFTLTWHIENFSMCPQKKGDSIRSPDFVLDALEKTTWYLVLYPKGNSSSDGSHVSCYLQRPKKEEEPERMAVDSSITLIASDMKSVKGCIDNKTLEKGQGIGFSNLIPIKSLTECKYTCTPKDVLTVLFCFRPVTESPEKTPDPVYVPSSIPTDTYSMQEMCTLISDVNNSKKNCIENSIFSTRILVERRLITWVIKDFKTQLQSGEKVHESVLSNLRKKSELLLSCYVSRDSDGDGGIKIDIERKDKNFKQMLMRCKVSVLGKNDVPLDSREAEHLFGEDYDVWSFPTIIKLSTLENLRFKIEDGDTLKLQCEFLTSYKGEEVTTCGNNLSESFISTDCLRQDIRGLLNDRELTEVTLTANWGYQLPVHKSLFCARSPVFRKMFSSDTQEKRTGVVSIADINAATLENMRNFIYTDSLPDLGFEDVITLYSAADKYEILTLKKQCAASLKFNLSTSNVCDVLMLADLHQDTDLLKYIYSYLRFHSKDVFRSTEWLNLMEINHKLTGETMRELLVKED